MFDEVAEYIIEFFPELLTLEETRARKWLLFPGHAKEPRTIPDDPATADLIELGLERLYIQISERVLHDHGDTIELNRCPKCERIVRTPLAQQCLHCGNDWHCSTSRTA